MRRRRGLLGVAVAGVVLGFAACGGRGPVKPGDASGIGNTGPAGTWGGGEADGGDASAGTSGAAGNDGGGTSYGDAGDAVVAYSCADAIGNVCTDDRTVSASWGVCGPDGRCQCGSLFELNPATGRCRIPLSADGGRDASDAPAPAPLPAWQSGTRLRARLLKAAATNDAIFQSVFDKDLGVACTFRRANDGPTRCMPPEIVTYFSDQGCTMPVAPFDKGCTVPTHLSRVASCQSSGFKVGAKISPTHIYSLTPAGPCTESPIQDTQDIYALTPVAATGFVAATVHFDPRGGGLEMRYWKSADGGLFPIGAWDTGRVASCVPGEDAYGDRCVPGVVANVSASLPHFSEGLCKQPLGYVESVSCDLEPASAVGVLEPSACGQSRAYYQAQRFLGTPYKLAGNTCYLSASTPSSWAFYTPGASIAPGSLPAMPRDLEGSGRLKVRRYRISAAKSIDSRPIFYDSTLGETCIPVDTTLGLRCLPSTSAGVTFYADDKCKVPAHVESKTKPDDPACAVPRPKIIYGYKNVETCSGLATLEVFAVGAAVTVPVIYRLEDTCKDAGISPAVNDVFATTPGTDATTAAVAFVTE